MVIAEPACRGPERLDDDVQGDGRGPDHDPPDQQLRALRFIPDRIARTPGDGRQGRQSKKRNYWPIDHDVGPAEIRQPFEHWREVGDPEPGPDRGAERNRQARQIIEPGASNRPREFPGERPHQRRQKDLRENPLDASERLPERRRDHEEDRAHQPSPMIETPPDQQQDRAEQETDERQRARHRERFAHRPVPRPRDHDQRSRDVQHRHRKERSEREARERGADGITRGGTELVQAPMSEAAEHPRQRSQVVDDPALIQPRRAPRTVPVHAFARRHGLRHVEQDAVMSHHVSRGRARRYRPSRWRGVPAPA